MEMSVPVSSFTMRAAMILMVMASSALPTVLLAQSSPFSNMQDSFNSPTYGRPKTETADRLTFVVMTEITLAGPLPSAGPGLVGEFIEIEVADGIARTSWIAGSPLSVEPLAGPLGHEEQSIFAKWSYDSSGLYRSQALPSGLIITQKRQRSAGSRWYKTWKLRVAGSNIAPPLLTDRRVFFGSQNNRVYGLRKRNGHQVWSTDLDQRISRRLVHFQGQDAISEETADDALDRELILVLPDPGSRLVVLDATTGGQVAEYNLPLNGGKFIGVPVVTPDASIVVAKESYNATEAALIVLKLTPLKTDVPVEPGSLDEKPSPDMTQQASTTRLVEQNAN
jgi:hypothetical protein